METNNITYEKIIDDTNKPMNGKVVDTIDEYIIINGIPYTKLSNSITQKKEIEAIKEGKKFDTEKLRWDLLDVDFPEGIVKILTFGAKKYDPNNWRKLENGTERCYAALMRHITEWRKGNKIDSESGLSHLYHAACNLYFLSWFDKENK